jgi:PknH-like extracellular domain
VSLRAKVSAIAFTAATCLLLAPTALASTHGPVQVTGKQLGSALLPPSDFVAGYSTIFAGNSGGSLEHGTTLTIPSMKCFDFWGSIGVSKGYGETAFADETNGFKSGSLRVAEIFSQAVYQFPSAHAAASLYGQISAKYRSCRTASVLDPKGGQIVDQVHSRSTQRVGGHQALLLVEYLTDTRIKGSPLVTDALWTLDGTDIYLVSSQLLSVRSPQPTLSSLTLKLIARVGALR